MREFSLAGIALCLEAATFFYTAADFQPRDFQLEASSSS